MEKHLDIGKSIIRKFYKYTEENHLDDETQFFPSIKVIITGVIEAYNNKDKKEKIKNELEQYTKEQYIKIWIRQSKRNRESVDVEEVKKEAKSAFEKRYNKK